MRRILPLLLLPLICSTTLAWSRAGHMVIGAIAYEDLKTNHPATLDKLLAVLRGHPQYATFQKRVNAVPEEGRDRYLLMIASRWADDVREDKQYNHPTWHYIDYGITAPGDKTPTLPPDEENALTALTAESATLKDVAAKPADRAVAACWVEHLVGDLHQPLHTVSLFSATLPKGDRGGNDIWVRFDTDSRSVNLHSLWDSLVTNTDRYTDAKNIATELMSRPAFKRDALPAAKDMDPGDWIKASVDIAYHTAYLDGTLKGGTKQQGTLLPPGYGKTAKAVAERQTVLAGYRLSSTLVALLGE